MDGTDIASNELHRKKRTIDEPRRGRPMVSIDQTVHQFAVLTGFLERRDGSKEHVCQFCRSRYPVQSADSFRAIPRNFDVTEIVFNLDALEYMLTGSFVVPPRHRLLGIGMKLAGLRRSLRRRIVDRFHGDSRDFQRASACPRCAARIAAGLAAFASLRLAEVADDDSVDWQRVYGFCVETARTIDEHMVFYEGA
jgi:hypothetical protein